MLETMNAPVEHTAHGREQYTTSPEQLLEATYGFVLAGGRGTRLKQLTEGRAKPAVPFAGKLRIIDFTLSNCVNSGITHVSVLTQYKSESLASHIRHAWGGLHASEGVHVDVVSPRSSPGQQKYSGTANAVFQNLDRVRAAKASFVLVLAGDHVYKMDYRRIIAEHIGHHADATVACIEVPLAEASSYGVMRVDAHGRIRSFQEKPACPAAIPGRPDVALVSMGIYVFNADFLRRQLDCDERDPASGHDFGHDIIPNIISHRRVFAHDYSLSCVNPFEDRPYWRDVGTLDAYWQANMDLLRPVPELDLHDAAWPIRSMEYPSQLPHPVRSAAARGAPAVESLLSAGCRVEHASVRHSVLFSKVEVDSGSEIADSLLLPGVKAGRNVVVRRAIIDSDCVLPDGFTVGVDPAQDRARFTVSEKGITLVTLAMLGQPLHTLDA